LKHDESRQGNSSAFAYYTADNMAANDDPVTDNRLQQYKDAHWATPPKNGVSQYKLAIGKAYIHPTRFRSNQKCPYF